MKRENISGITSESKQAISLDRNSATSFYRQIADRLEQEIRSGLYAAHGKLPSEHELGERFGVSRVTVRQAVAWLAEQGYITRTRGKGTFVAGQKLRHDLPSMKGFYDSLVSQGVEPETQLNEFAVARRPDLVTCGLANADGACFYLRRIYRVDGIPIAMVAAHLPPECAEISWQQASETPIYGILERLLNLRIIRANVRIRAQSAGSKIGKALGLGARAAVLVMERESFCANDQIKEQSYFYIRPENYEFLISAQGPLPISSAIRGANRAGNHGAS